MNEKKDIKIQIVTICGGLGSQMVKYAFFLELKRRNAELGNNYKILIDTSPYIKNKSWNGYELEKIFRIQDEDVCDDLTEKEIELLKKSEKKSWQIALCHYGEEQTNMTYFIEGKRKKNFKISSVNRNIKRQDFKITEKLKWAWKMLILHAITPGDKYRDADFDIPGVTYFDEFCPVSDEYLLKDKDLLKRIFSFPKFIDERDIAVSEKMLTCESVALHIRRSDHMYDQAELFVRHYFKKAMDYIRCKSSENLFIYIFSDDIDWCRNNLNDLGVVDSDAIVFVDWHKPEDAFRDMQLMTYCKHNILAKSTFAWWGYYLSKWRYKDKIVIAPKKYWTELEVHL